MVGRGAHVFQETPSHISTKNRKKHQLGQPRKLVSESPLKLKVNFRHPLQQQPFKKQKINF